MKKTINYILAAFSAVVLVSSCNLDLFPNGSIAYDEDGALFTNEKELGYLENGLYSSYRSGFYGEYAIVLDNVVSRKHVPNNDESQPTYKDNNFLGLGGHFTSSSAYNT